MILLFFSFARSTHLLCKKYSREYIWNEKKITFQWSWLGTHYLKTIPAHQSQGRWASFKNTCLVIGELELFSKKSRLLSFKTHHCLKTGAFCFQDASLAKLNTSSCFPNPCLNGGSCVDGLQGRGYVCICPVGREGKICQDRKGTWSWLIWRSTGQLW